MKYLTIFALAPLAFHIHAAHIIDHSSIDLSSVMLEASQTSNSNSELAQSYSELGHVQLDNHSFTRKQQLFYGIPVYGYSIVSDDSSQGYHSTIAGEVVVGLEGDIESTLPMINQQQAISIASDFNHANNGARTVAPSFANSGADTAQLMVWLDEEQTAHLAYRVDAQRFNGQTPSRPITFVDAKTGDVLDSWEGIAFQKAEGPGGNTKSGRYYFGTNTKFGGFDVNSRCQFDSPTVVTYDMKNQQWGGQVHRFNCQVNNYRQINGAYAPMNDAHYFGQRTFDMYEEWLNTRPIRQKLSMRVHYGSNYGNAFWDGRQMTFGDGNNYMYPLATWDVIAHEVSHGFTEQNSGLEYRGMSGGMNESFSDVAAAALAQYVHGEFNWKMGEHVMKNASAMRYFIEPSQDGMSIGHASRYYNGIDVHHSSGVFNKAFYHLATSQGWDIQKAFKAYAVANQLFWTPRSTFQQGAEGVCKASEKLGYNGQAVSNAFNQVGISVHCGSGQPSPRPNPSPTPNPTPQPSPNGDVIEITLDNPVLINNQSNEQRYILRNASINDLWVQTNGGTGDVTLYTTIERPVSSSDYDCMSSAGGNNEYCGYGGIQGTDIQILVTGAQSTNNAYIAVSESISFPQGPQQEPHDLCSGLGEWSLNTYYPAGSSVQYWGNKFTTDSDSWGQNPFGGFSTWIHQGLCD